MKTFSGDKFSWKDGKGVTELSDITELPAPLVGLPREFMIESHRTGVTKRFLFEGVDRECGETTGWRFRAEDGSARVLIIND